MSNLFSNEKINTGRQIELDIVRAFSIIFMIFIHMLMVVTAFDNTVSANYLFVFYDILGKPYVAVIFMFCMGVGVVYSRRSQWDIMVKRGVMLFLLGILVNVFEFFLPCFVCGTLLGKWDIFPTAGGLLLFCVDILAFAGLAFILMGILKKFELSDKWLIVIAVALSVIGSLTRFTDFGVPVINLFFANFIGSKGGFTAFPLFNWFVFPIAGIIWAKYFIRAKDKDQFFKFWPVFIIIPLIYFIWSINVDGGFLSDNHHYYFMTTIDVVFCLLNTHGFIGLCYQLSKILPESLKKTSSIISSNITNIYIIQWFFIPLILIFLVYLVKGIVFNDLITAALSIFVLVLSTVIAVYYKKLRSAS